MLIPSLQLSSKHTVMRIYELADASNKQPMIQRLTWPIYETDSEWSILDGLMKVPRLLQN
jgi:hypothetical protein